MPLIERFYKIINKTLT